MKQKSVRGICISFVLGLWLLVPNRGLAVTDDGITLDQAVAKIVSRIKVFSERGRNGQITSIVVGNFTSRGNSTITTGPHVSKLLKEHFERAKIKPELISTYSIEGQLSVKHDLEEQANETTRRRSGVVIEFQVHEDGRTVFDSSEDATVNDIERQTKGERHPPVTNSQDVLVLAGANAAISGNKNRQQQYDSIKNALKDRGSGAEVHASSILNLKGTPFSIEVQVAHSSGDGSTRSVPPLSSYDPRPIKLTSAGSETLHFVQFKPDEVYAIRIINDADFDAAVELTIDGLNAYEFSEDKKVLSGFTIVGKKSSGVIPGWHRRRATGGKSPSETFDAFLVGEYAETPEAKNLSTNPAVIGTITVSFRAAWSEKESPPSDENRLPGLTKMGDLNTRPGPPIDAPFTRVQRIIGKNRGSLTLRYDK